MTTVIIFSICLIEITTFVFGVLFGQIMTYKHIHEIERKYKQ